MRIELSVFELEDLAVKATRLRVGECVSVVKESDDTRVRTTITISRPSATAPHVVEITQAWVRAQIAEKIRARKP